MANCTSCGCELKPGAKFCENCGATVPQAPVNPAPQPQMAYQNPSYGVNQAPQQAPQGPQTAPQQAPQGPQDAPQQAPEQRGNVPPVNPNGTQPYNYTPVAPIIPVQQKTTNGMAIASLVMGILAFISPMCCCLGLVIVSQIFGIIFGILGIVFGILSKKKNGGKVPGMGVAGIILGAFGLVTNLVLLIIFVASVGVASGGTDGIAELLRKLGVDESTIEQIIDSIR